MGRDHRLACALVVAITSALSIVALGAACGTSLPTPRTGSPPAGSRVYVEVPYPPPPARVEVVPERPRPDSVWVDGQWTWQGKRWVWASGGWVTPPANAYFVPWLTYRDSQGRLLFAASSWHAADGRPIAQPPTLAAALSTPGEAPTAPVSSSGPPL